MNLFFVALGGALGSILRFLAMKGVAAWQKSGAFSMGAGAVNMVATFPLPVLLVNVAGSFLLGVFHFFWMEYFSSIPENFRLFFSVGFLGAFTTFSAFSLDVLRLIQAGHLAQSGLYILVSVLLSISALFLGFFLMKVIF